MRQRATPPRSERAAVITAAIAIHAFLIAILVSVSAARPVVKASPGGIAMVALPLAQEADGKPPPPALPSKVADDKRVLAEPAFSADPDSAAQGSQGGCATLELVRKALLADPAAVAAVVHAPREARSIAEAVVIWNAGWADLARDVEAPLGPARQVLEQSIASIPAECLNEEIAGPRLFLIPAGEGANMFLVVGSGKWSWGQLVANDPAAAPTSAETIRPPEMRIWDWFSSIAPR